MERCSSTGLRTACLLALMLAAGLIAPAAAQFGGPKKEEKKAPANKDDLKYIKCGVCEAVVKHAMKATKVLREAATAHKPVAEGDILDQLEDMCNPDKEAGEWIAQIDLVEDGDKLKLVDMGQMGHCDIECRTVARSCADLFEGVDLTELSPMLYKSKGRSAIIQSLCYEESNVCVKKPPPLPKGRPAGPAFKPMTAEQVQHKKMLRSMKDAGLSGTMYDRDTLMEEMEQMKEMGMDMDGLDMDGVGEGPKPTVESGSPPAVAGITEDIQRAKAAVKEGVGMVKEGAAKVVKMATNLVNKVTGKKEEL